MTANQVRNVGLLAAGAIAGGVLAATITASAADSGDSTTTPTPSAVAPAAPGVPPGGPGDGHFGGPRGGLGPDPVRSDEKTPSDDIVATLTKKAEAEVDGGTVIRVETDAGDAAYEAHMQKADGTLVTVKFNKNLEVIEVQDGMGLGDPPPAGAPAAPSSGTTDGTSSSA
jgi:hypothetical protein